MDHEIATRDELTEKYLLGELSAEQREDFEEHYFGCRTCGEAVSTGTAFVANARAVFAEAAAGRTVLESNKAPFWKRLFDWPVLIPSAATALLAFLMIYQNAITIPQLRHSIEPQAVASLVLIPAARGDEQAIVVGQKDRFVHLSFDVNSRDRFANYDCDFLNGDGRSVFHVTASCCETGSLNLMVPVEHFQAGSYTLVLSGVNNGAKTELDRFRFRLDRKQT